MKKSIIITILFVLGISYPVAAEFYRYKDKHGNTIYTDDFSKVPPEQRETTQSYDEYVSSPAMDNDETASKQSGASADANAQIDAEGQRLKEQEKTLSNEFDGLTAERNSLDKEKKEAVTEAQIRSYNNKVVEFNARIKAYEEKRKALTTDMEKYKERIKKQESEQQPQ